MLVGLTGRVLEDRTNAGLAYLAAPRTWFVGSDAGNDENDENCDNVNKMSKTNDFVSDLSMKKLSRTILQKPRFYLMYRVFTFYKCDPQLPAGQDFLWPCDAIIIINIMVTDHWLWSPYKYQKYSVCRVKNKKQNKNIQIVWSSYPKTLLSWTAPALMLVFTTR